MRDTYLTPQDAVARAGQYIEHEIHLIDQYDLGAEGAYRVVVDAVPRVFKYWSGERARALDLPCSIAAHTVLQRFGWPLPAIHFWHSEPTFAFVLEAQMPGQRVVAVSDTLCQRLLTLLAAVPRGNGSRRSATAAWLAFLERSLYHDAALSPCRPVALQRTSLGKRVVDDARHAFRAARADLAAADDVIHGDFSTGNILCDTAGRLTAILDWQHSGIGHRGFDLVGLEWDLALRLNVGSAPALARVTAYVNEHVEESVCAFCRAYYGVWNLSWSHNTQYEADVLRAAAAIGIM